MTQYIDKDAVVAEIERQQRRLDTVGQTNELELRKNAAIQNGVYCSLLSFINTLEVKEVDLEKEFNNYTKNILACDVQFEPFTHLYNCAKHFFELGLKVQKGE